METALPYVQAYDGQQSTIAHELLAIAYWLEKAELAQVARERAQAA